MIVRGLFILFAFLAPFLFPYPLTLMISMLAGIIFPPVPLLVGLLVDALYYHPALAVPPYGTLFGAVASVAALFLGRFIRARIVSL